MPVVDSRKRELAQIHIAIGELGWDDGHYRAVLHATTGQRSSADLNSVQRRAFIAHLKTCGWDGGKKPAPPRLTKQQYRIRNAVEGPEDGGGHHERL